MLRKSSFGLLVLAMLALLTTGCANRATAKIDPNARLDTIKTMHVVKIPDETANISTMIADKLRTKGYQVSSSTEKPQNVDAIVTYVDRWMWDITMYLLELTVTIRDGKTEFPLATGNSLHGSLTRLSAQEMVDEVMGNIFREGKIAEARK